MKLHEVPQENVETADTTDWFSLFYRRANHYSLLTKEQEVELAQAIERGDLEALAACFATTARVHDEGRMVEGPPRSNSGWPRRRQTGRL